MSMCHNQFVFIDEYIALSGCKDTKFMETIHKKATLFLLFCTFSRTFAPMNYHEIILRAGHLPAADIAEAVNRQLAANPSLVITAPPGAGKSTLLPLTILEGMGSGSLPFTGKVMMLEPRRIAARQIAERMADILNEPVGKTVGYRVRFDTKVSAETRLEVVTEGILTRMIVADPTLEGVDVVVFDEFHERNLQSDLALALVRQCQELLRPDLRIVIMSATIDASRICQALRAPLIESEGRMFPVEIRYAEEEIGGGDPYRSNSPDAIAKAVAATIVRAHREHGGDILAFLPGQGEIERCAELLGDSLSPTAVLPLYGNLSPALQRKAIAPSLPGERKVVLATPIAETSLTIEGVRIVVDSGRYKKMTVEPQSGLSRLRTHLVSKDMATQRTGRAGRVAEGVCYRLWTRTSEHGMEEQRVPEIEEAELSNLLLDILSFGESDAGSLPWLTPPPGAHLQEAYGLLRSLGAIDERNRITPLGKKMEQMPCHPRISRMILGAKGLTEISDAKGKAAQALACDIAALLEEKIPGDPADCDITFRINQLRECRRRRQLGAWKRIEQVAAEYRRMAHAGEDKSTVGGFPADNSIVDGESIGLLLTYAYPERIAKSLDSVGHFRLASGKDVSIPTDDPMSARPWIVVALLFDRVLLAAPLDIQQLIKTSPSGIIRRRDRIAWDSKQGKVVMQREWAIGKLLVDSKPIHDCDNARVIAIICEAVKKDGLSMLDWSDSVKALQRRVAQVALWHPELSLPDLSTDHLTATAEDWLPFYLDQGGHVRQTVAEMKKIDLREAVWNILPYDLQQQVDRLAPTYIEVPTGSRIRVDYRQGAEAPVLSVRLQECFGMTDTPRVDGGRRPVLMELLSPGFKPVQLTQDLASFWQAAYFEVRKEMKRRYPKHYWPENPLEAEAVKGVKRK